MTDGTVMVERDYTWMDAARVSSQYEVDHMLLDEARICGGTVETTTTWQEFDHQE